MYNKISNFDDNQDFNELSLNFNSKNNFESNFVDNEINNPNFDATNSINDMVENSNEEKFTTDEMMWRYKILNNPLNPKKFFIFLHGLGLDYEDMIDLGLIFKKQYEDFGIISLGGFEKYAHASFGRQWFDLSDRNDLVVQKETKRSFEMLEKFLDYLAKKFNLNYEDIILIGFSQGGMLASYAGMSLNLGGVIGFASCSVVPRENIKTSTPICFIHGENDEIIPLNLFLRTMDMAKRYTTSASIKYLTIPNLKHAISFQGIKFSFDFIDELIQTKLNY